jgi:hypothetical protein
MERSERARAACKSSSEQSSSSKAAGGDGSTTPSDVSFALPSPSSSLVTFYPIWCVIAQLLFLLSFGWLVFFDNPSPLTILSLPIACCSPFPRGGMHLKKQEHKQCYKKSPFTMMCVYSKGRAQGAWGGGGGVGVTKIFGEKLTHKPPRFT